METYQGVLRVKAGGAYTLAYASLSTDGNAQVRSQNTTNTVFATYSVINLQAMFDAGGTGSTVGYNSYVSDADEDSVGSVIDLFFSLGDTSAKFYIIDIEANAVTPFAQDDWPNYYNDFTGYQLALGYKFTDRINIDLRRFDGERKSDSKQSEERIQLNVNFKF